jgi:hypothetical protein
VDEKPVSGCRSVCFGATCDVRVVGCSASRGHASEEELDQIGFQVGCKLAERYSKDRCLHGHACLCLCSCYGFFLLKK